MALLIKSASIGQRRIKVYYDRALEEYRTKFYIHTEYQSEADYFCPDEEDAFGTARLFLWEGIENIQRRLQEFKEQHGHGWRAVLREYWFSNQDLQQPNGHLLRIVRNHYAGQLDDMTRAILG